MKKMLSFGEFVPATSSYKTDMRRLVNARPYSQCLLMGTRANISASGGRTEDHFTALSEVRGHATAVAL